MKVLIISEHRWGSGAAIAARRLAASLAVAGHDVVFAWLFNRPGAPEAPGLREASIERGRDPFTKLLTRALFRLHERLSVLPQPIAAASQRTVLRLVFAANARRLRNLLRREKPDVVNVHNFSLITSHGAVAKLAERHPLVVTLHDQHGIRGWTYLYANRKGSPRRTPNARLFLSSADVAALVRRSRAHFAAPSRWLAADARAAGAFSRTHHIPYGIDTQSFRPEPPEEAMRRQQIPADPTRVTLLFVGALLTSDRKNLALLLEALRHVEGAPVRLLCLGAGGADFADLPVPVINLGHKTRVEDLRDVYSAADLFVIPSLADNLPNTVLESLLCATPVLGARVGGITDMVVEGETGWLFNPRDAEELAAAIRRLSGDRPALEAMRPRCRSFAEARYATHRQAQDYEQLYSQLIAERQK